MEDEYEKKKLMEALQSLSDKRSAEKAPFGSVTPDLASQNLAKGDLDKEVMQVKRIGESNPDITPSRTLVPGSGVPTIEAPRAEKMTDIGEFRQRQADLDIKNKLKASFKAAAEAGDTGMMDKLRKVAAKMSKGLKMLPVVGAAASLVGADDASAAIPILDSADSVGMSAADENMMLAEEGARVDYGNSPARLARLRALSRMKK